MKAILVVAILAGLLTPSFCFRKQKVHVKGVLMCGNGPASGVKVELYDEDSGK